VNDPLAGKPAPKERLAHIPTLVSDYFYLAPDPSDTTQRVKFGTSGHRGSSLKKSFNEAHIIAITQAICEYKKAHSITGAIFIGIDTHALSTPAQMSALRVLARNEVHTIRSHTYAPTPVISYTILQHNKEKAIVDGIVVTPSHNPPEDGGFKYNPPHGGPADTQVTQEIEARANELLGQDLSLPSYEEAIAHPSIQEADLITPYVENLATIVDIDAIKESGLKIAADPLGGSTIEVYKKINEIHGLSLTILHDWVDPTFSFMSLDHDGKIRMDCSSPYAMASLLEHKEDFDLAFANDTDGDRHGIVTPEGGLLNPNHFLSVAIWYLFKHRTWPKGLKVGKTLVSSSMIDRVAASLGVEVYETPVGFKWFSQGLYEGWLGFGGEESAGASFLRFDGSIWTTDKDGIIMGLLAAEIKAKIKDPALIYQDLEEAFGKSYYKRLDIPADAATKAILKSLSPAQIPLDTLAEEPIEAIYTKAPGNGAPIGGVKITTRNGWIAMRPSGTEDVYKIYAESFISEAHLHRLLQEAQSLVENLLKDRA